MTLSPTEQSILSFLDRVAGATPYGTSIALGLGEKRTLLAMDRLLRFGLIAEQPNTANSGHATARPTQAYTLSIG